MSPQFIDDKAPICVPFILNRLEAHQRHHPHASSSRRPLIIGLNGLQGVGKTTLVAPLAVALMRANIPTLVCSIDDFYLTREDQAALARDHPDNALWQNRGEPGTHDVALAKSFFASLVQGLPTSLPQYDKAAFSGQGDRLPRSLWKPVNQPHQPPPQVIILEGWCVGFRPLSAAQVEARFESGDTWTLRRHRLEHLLLVNEKLSEYDSITDLFDAFIHIDSEDVQYVYDWRLEQEEHLRAARGDPNAGMTREQVVKFVDAYFPGYELYTQGVRTGVLPNKPGSQLRMIVGRDRKVKQVINI